MGVSRDTSFISENKVLLISVASCSNSSAISLGLGSRLFDFYILHAILCLYDLSLSFDWANHQYFDRPKDLDLILT
jgi:hypothetical protein